MRIGAVAAHFGRDVERSVVKVEGIIAEARGADVDLLVLPHASLGGYLTDLQHPATDDLPPGLREDGPEIARLIAACGPLVVCLGYSEALDGPRPLAGAALCLHGGGVLGRHRKVHQPPGERSVYAAGDRFAAFDTPVGRIGMLIDYDKTFPEAARALALDGATTIACLSAWPASVTDRTRRLTHDRQSRLFDLYDAARAAENQVVWVSSNQTGLMGTLRFLGRAKVVGPGGDVLARTTGKGAMALTDVDVDLEVARARRQLHHLDELIALTDRVDGVVR
ncbi:apolipoprotein N-acyltransferase [Marmoricola endophyticus]|uniref:Apolipoprotein N-acyltransferase n=1 Tax=Marmoricola endophyticus TaxID=2040280 RepID=A0A917F455_9ACTN|nr:carbon-nitrogen hydrolase family protein [Marmoricola endophyticus]GGF44222.1 apolipoprotein N-acyltransferase [Marmoricola endophyticus]